MVVLLGYGLVSVPRNYSRKSNQKLMLRYILFRLCSSTSLFSLRRYYRYEAAVLDDARNNLLFDFQDIVKRIINIQEGGDASDDILQKCDLILARVR